MRIRSVAVIAMILGSGLVTIGQKVIKDTIKSGGKERGYYLFVPDHLDVAKPAPMIVMLHGSGHNGLSLVEKWTGLAKKEGIILLGPDAADPAQWSVPSDAPDPLHELIEAIKKKYAVDPRRVYLFGHSAGAVVSYYVALMESEYFAAAAIHAGSMRPSDTAIIAQAKRKVPIAVWVGTNDAFFPLKDVRATVDMLKTHGIDATLTEMKGRTHNYYEHSDEVNDMAWAFLKDKSLTADPKYEQYLWKN
jgi:poly(3-hydroxybutyrate) depolymerase